MEVVIIADDLTGALDSSVFFAARGLRTVCALTPGHLGDALASGAEVVAVSTGSREISEAAAAERLRAVAGVLSRHPAAQGALRMKKIDSRLKGHVAAETAALRAEGEVVLLCPAIPVLGRIVQDGLLQGAGVAVPLPVAELAGIPGARVLDAPSQDALSAEIAAHAGPALFVGAAGLALALAKRLGGAAAAPAPVLQAPALFAIGSRDPITLAQLSAFRPCPAPNGRLQDAPEGQPEVIQMTAGTEEIDGTAAAEAFAETIAARLRLTRPRTLLACGGETGGAILARLGCGLVEVLGEALPGLPVSRALDGPAGLTLVTKSGGFGDPGTLASLAASLVGNEAVS